MSEKVSSLRSIRVLRIPREEYSFERIENLSRIVTDKNLSFPYCRLLTNFQQFRLANRFGSNICNITRNMIIILLGRRTFSSVIGRFSLGVIDLWESDAGNFLVDHVELYLQLDRSFPVKSLYGIRRQSVTHAMPFIHFNY